MPHERRYLGIGNAVSEGIRCESVTKAIGDAMLDACLDAQTPKPASDCLRRHPLPIFAGEQQTFGAMGNPLPKDGDGFRRQIENPNLAEMSRLVFSY